MKKVIIKQKNGEIFAVFFGSYKSKYTCFSSTEMCHFEIDAQYIRSAKTYKGETYDHINTLKHVGYDNIKIMKRMCYK